MRKRVLVLPIAAAIITALCVYKLVRDETASSGVAPMSRRPAPLFELFNAERPPELVRLSSYIGRHPIIVVFFDARLGAARDPRLLRLYRDVDRIRDAGIKVFAVSSALPQENRKVVERMQNSGRDAPFPLLTDLPPTPQAPQRGYVVHKAWGRYDAARGEPLLGIFLIDRAGRVAWAAGAPVPVEPDDAELERFIAGR